MHATISRKSWQKPRESQEISVEVTVRKVATNDGLGINGATVLLVGNKIYCFGGYSSSARFGNVLHLQVDSADSTVSAKWIELKDEEGISDRSFHAAALANDKIYLYGGYDIFELESFHEMLEFDIVMRKLRKLSPPQCILARVGVSAVYADWKHEILFFGGTRAKDQSPEPSNIFTFNVDNLAWGVVKSKGELPEARKGHSAILDGSKQMYVFGGRNEDKNYLNDLWIADLSKHSTVTWIMVQSTNPAPAGRIYPCLYKLGSMMVIFGGFNKDIGISDLTDVYALRSNKWVKAQESSQPSGSFALVRYHRSVKIAGGIIAFAIAGVYKLEVKEDEGTSAHCSLTLG